MDRLSPFLSEHISIDETCKLPIVADDETDQCQDGFSKFERIITTHPPILESLLLQLPTSALLSLYYTSKYLQSFLQAYPIAWKYLSFRLFGSSTSITGLTPSGNDAAIETASLRSRQYALDLLLLSVVGPFGTRLCNLDLDNTAVSGQTLTSTVLPARRGTLQHLSVRGCKNVSLKYHILPYLTLYSLQKAAVSSAARVGILALKSLYTFRCRHHRRRPYFPGSLQRRDSDAEPTHELIKICRDLGIWTDTSWCPTPGGRCLRRKEYYTGRTAEGRGEVWVVYDRLWRSSNKIGQSESVKCSKATRRRGLMWEEAEIGEEGEPLGVGSCKGDEGKTIPAHLRQSHRVFVDNYKCHDCGGPIAERCEICSVRMHCMGCRKILCASCAFSRPLPEKRTKSAGDDGPVSAILRKGQKDMFWWAPGETRSPNIMQETNNVNTNPSTTPKLKLQWCCVQPSNFGGGGYFSNGVDENKASRLRTAPLPQGHGWEDPEFARLRQGDDTFPKTPRRETASSDWTPKKGREQISYLLQQASSSDDDPHSPRNLCQECYQTNGWQGSCQSCREPFCLQHDLPGSEMRVCGYRSLSLETDNRKLQAEAKAWKLASLMFSIPGLSQRLVDILVSLGAGKSAMVQKLANIKPSICPSDEEAVTFDSSDLKKRLTTLPVGVVQSANQIIEALEIYFPTHNFPMFPIASLAKTPLFLMFLLRTIFVMGSRAQPEPRLIGEPWHGCASFLCPQSRPAGDHRPNCPALVKVCTLCKVHVCPECLSEHPPCDCSHCGTCYFCPGCYLELRDVLCKKSEEVEAARVWRISKEIADDVAEQLGQFFGAIALSQERQERPDVDPEQVLESVGELFTIWEGS